MKDVFFSILIIPSEIKPAATCLAAVGVVEVPRGEWNDLIPNLVTNAQAEDFNIRMASLMTLGYLCEDIEPCYIEESQMNEILYACLSNVSPQNIKISQIAVRAFARAAPYTNKNF